VIALVRRSFARIAPALAAIALVVAAFQAVLVAAAAVIVGGGGTGSLARLIPSFLQQSIGVAFLSFAGIATIGFFHAAVVMILVLFAVYLASEPAGDVESGIVDLLMARPLPRHWLVTRSIMVMTVSIALLSGVMGVALRIALALLSDAPETWPSLRVVLTLAVHLTIVAWCFGAWSLAASAWVRRRATAVAVVSIAAMAFYLLDFVGTIWKAAAGVASLSPFYYFHGGDILAGTANTTRDLAVLGAISAIGFALAYWRFDRRDL
jgi:beta-exotoxin I transport system permease protein